LMTNLIGSWLEDSMSYWSLRVSTRKVQICFCKMVRDGGCKTAIVKAKLQFCFCFCNTVRDGLTSCSQSINITVLRVEWKIFMYSTVQAALLHRWLQTGHDDDVTPRMMMTSPHDSWRLSWRRCPVQQTDRQTDRHRVLL
jgi:hypothetical protein